MPTGGIGTISGKMVMRTRDWERGLSSATMSLKTHGRQAKKIFAETRTASERYRMKVAEVSAMHKRSMLDTDTYRRKLAALRREYVATSTAAGRFTRAAGSMLGFSGGAAGGARGLLAPLVATVGGTKAFRRAERTRAAMRSSQAIMGDLSPNLRDEMFSAASTASGGTKFSTEEASRAFYFLASAGLDARQSIAALPTVAKFAQAGMFDLSRATDLLTDSQMAMGMASKDTAENMREMTRVGDVLVGANTIANASVEQFSEALTNKAAAALRMVNKDIEEGVAWLAVYAQQGIKGADAGTALGIVLRDLQTKAIKNAGAFADLNIKVFDTEGAMRNMADVIGDMETALGGLSAEGKKTALMHLGLADKSVAYTQVLLGMSEAGREFEEHLRSMAGTMDNVAGKQLTDFAKGWERVKSAWDSIATGPAGKAMDTVGKMMQGAASGTLSGFAEAAAEPARTWYSGVWDRFQGVGRAWAWNANLGQGDYPTGKSEERRGAALDVAIGRARQRNADAARRAEEARARGARFRGGLSSAARGAIGFRGWGNLSAGLGNSLSAIGRGATWNFRAARWAGRRLWSRGSNVDLAGQAAAREKKLQPLIAGAMGLLGGGSDGAALRFASANVYRSEAASNAIARAMAPGATDSRQRTEESILAELKKERAENREMMVIARRIAEKLFVPTEIDVPPG